MRWADEDSVRLLISIGGVESLAVRRATARGGPHFVFAQDVAGTDNHETARTLV